MSDETGKLRWDGGTVSVTWHHSKGSTTYLILGHSAGGNLYTPTLVKFAVALASRGVGAVRFNFPYAEAKRKVPDSQATLEACCRSVAEHVASRASGLFLGGRSMGGRIASHLVADGFPATGLVFLGYPLHPPGQPTRLRDAHLRKVHVPMLFLQGSRDAFAQPDLLARTVSQLKTATLHIVEGGDHGLSVRGRAPEDVTQELLDTTVDWINVLV